MYEPCTESVWKVYETCTKSVRKVYEQYTKSVQVYQTWAAEQDLAIYAEPLFSLLKRHLFGPQGALEGDSQPLEV